MSDAERHYDVELQEALDGRLDRVVQGALEAHVAACPVCRARMEALAATRDAVRRVGEESVPADLARDILAALRAEPLPATTAPPRARARVPRWAWGLAAAAAVVLAAWLGWPRPATPLPAAVAADYRAYRDGELPLDFRSGDVAEVEAWFARRGLETRVFDLAMMQWVVEGGRAHRLQGQPSALFVYRTADGRRLVCQMYGGRAGDLPSPAARRAHDGIEFRVYDEAGVTLVFWQEGDLVCVLAGEGPPEDVIQLAFAKAVKV
jgi:anti-sigma factor RsiW